MGGEDRIVPPYSGERQDLLAGTIRVFLSDALIVPTGLIATAFLTRRLGPHDYGLFTLAATLVAWLQWSITSMFTRATVKFVGEADNWQPIGTVVLRLHLAISGAVTLLLWVLAGPIAGLLGQPELATYVRLFALDIPIFCLAQAHRDILVGIGGYRERASVSTGRWISRLLLIVLLVQLGLSVHGAILASIGASWIQLIIGRRYVRPSLFNQAAFPTRRLWGYAVPLSLFALTIRLYEKLDLFVLKALGATAAEAGFYGAAQNLSLAPAIFAMAFSPLLLSSLGHLIGIGEAQRARQIGRDAMRLVIGLLPFAAMTAGAAPEIVGLLFGRQFVSAAAPLSVLIFGTVGLVMISVATVILTADGRPVLTVALTGPLIPLALIGHLYAIPRWGTVGAALVTGLGAWASALAAVVAVHRTWRILPPAGTLLRSAVVCVLAYQVAVVWKTPGGLLFLKVVTISLGIVTAFLILDEFGSYESWPARSIFRYRAASGQRCREIQ